MSPPPGLNLAGSSSLLDRPASPFSRLSSRSASRSGSRSRRSSPSSSSLPPNPEPVTTFIPQRLTVDAYPRHQSEDEGADADEGNDQHDVNNEWSKLDPNPWRRNSAAFKRASHLWKKSKTRKTVLHVLKHGEGRDSFLQVAYSLVLLLHSSLRFPPPRTHLESVLAPGGFLLTRLFSRSLRAQTMQRIYTAAEGLANVRRIVLLARWIQAGTEAAMERMGTKPLTPTSRQLQPTELAPSPSATPGAGGAGNESITLDDAKEEGFRWLQPQSLAPFDTGSVEDQVVEQVDREAASREAGAEAQASQLSTVSSWRQTWEARLSSVCDALAVLGEACDVAAFMAGSGLFWRAVGFTELGILGRRRRKGIERVGVLLSLCSVVLSLLRLRMQRLRLRAELRSAHRRIIRANDRIGWASELSGKRIPTGAAISYRKSNASLAEQVRGSAAAQSSQQPSLEGRRDGEEEEEKQTEDEGKEKEEGGETDTHTDTHAVPAAVQLRPYGPGIQEALEDLDDASSQRSDDAQDAHAHTHTLSPSSLLQSTERELLDAEIDLARARHALVWSFWERIALVADAVFLALETARPDADKEGLEAWSGILAGGIRLCKVWDQVKWARG
ncbi:hypothetical protein ACQY0O_001315 [Thecaphora frezii]